MITTKSYSPQLKCERNEIPCAHCGDSCASTDIAIGEKFFCCNGCKTVFELLTAKNLCSYYTIDKKTPGLTPKDHVYNRRFGFLDDESIIKQLLEFSDGNLRMVTFHIPGMHCSSCIWLLEKLHMLHSGVVKSLVHFPKKEVSITYKADAISLRELVVQLASIGYEPLINLHSVAEKRRSTTNKKLYYKIGVAGFAFGNIMLYSFPEYLAGAGNLDPVFRKFFSSLNVLLAIPVFFYSSSEYFRSAWNGLKQWQLTIDIPISLGLVVLFTRSLFEIMMQTGPGFLDSFTGLVFFLLIGKIFQKKSYDALSFERDFRSYFPLSATIKEGGHESTIPLTKLKVGDRIVVRNQELVPADSVLLRGEGSIDYSFVTGEAEPVAKKSGDGIHAGGRQSGQAIELEVVKDISQSYLIRLWNNDVFTKPSTAKLPRIINQVSSYFTGIVLLIAFAAAGFWLTVDVAMATTVFTAVLIVACPCALALASPFALGSAQRIFGNNQFYMKNTETVENLARVDTVVFDKTGTLTLSTQGSVQFIGAKLSSEERECVRSLARHSTHALSRRIYSLIDAEGATDIHDFIEIPGKGISACVLDRHLRLGSQEWTKYPFASESSVGETYVFLTIDGQPRGYFSIGNRYRKGLEAMISTIKKRFQLIILSGDSNREEETLSEIFGEHVPMYFEYSPEDKLEFVSAMQADGKHVLMIGDGLNDAGALKAADVGISISENINTFSPACDAILSAERFHHFDRFLRFAKSSVSILYISFAVSFLYNSIGLSFAVAGLLSPLTSAILMPISSVTVVAFTTLATRIRARQLEIFG